LGTTLALLWLLHFGGRSQFALLKEVAMAGSSRHDMEVPTAHAKQQGEVLKTGFTANPFMLTLCVKV